MKVHLAQFNVAKPNFPLSHPSMREFVSNLGRINEMARESEGFVWKLQDETGHSAFIRTLENPDMAINLSVWESLDSLTRFLKYSDHSYFYTHRRSWFQNLDKPYSVLWWLAKGTLPTLDDAWRRLYLLRTRGATRDAFTFNQPYPSEGGPT